MSASRRGAGPAVLASCVAGLAALAIGAAGPLDETLASLVQAERDFAAAARARGIRGGFLEYLAEEAIVFRPRPLAARAWYERQPEGQEVLTWEPAFAEASAAGDLGYTTGPWEFRKQPSSADPTARGHYVSVWRRRRDGSWRVLIDAGISHARAEWAGQQAVTSRRSADASEARELDEEKLRRERNALVERDGRLSKAAAKRGSVKKLIAAFSKDVRVYREGTPPAIGEDAARTAVATEPGSTTWQTDGAVVSRSGDLGYTYGVASTGAAEGRTSLESSYLRVWRRSGGDWKVILDLAVPIRE